MTLDPSAWRADDSVAFDAAREVVSTATAVLFNLADTGVLDLPAAVAEARKLRRSLLSVDGFDREAVDGFIRRLDDRVAELKGLQR
jgi:hypothetical protein